MLVALILVFFISTITFVYPYILYGFILRFLPTVPIRVNEHFRLSLSLLFCAYNERSHLDAKLRNLIELKKDNPDIEILAFDDGSNDGTFELLSGHPEILKVKRGNGRNGKAHGMKILAKQARGDVLVFTDANVTLRKDALRNLSRYYADGDVGGVLGSLHYLEDNASVTAHVGSVYWRLEERLKDEESRTGNVLGADGSIFSLRRKLYPEFPDTVLDDLTVSMAAIFAGKRLVKANDVVAYEAIVSARKDEVRRKIRIGSRAYHTHIYLHPKLRLMQPLNRFKYISRKLVRWFGGVSLAIGAMSGATLIFMLSPLFLLMLVILTSLVLVLGVYLQHRIVVALMEIVVAIFATLTGVLKAMSGHTNVIWSPAASR
jgi:cellulose synthase/poly-beta-1,6-N-acetylglucosamine synthase-like glycosyltransferase